MYKRQVHSAIGRRTPDLVRAAEGIRTSLRQFSVSLDRAAAEDDGSFSFFPTSPNPKVLSQ